MQCPQCQHDNREGAKFCEECGSRFVHRCPNCEHEVRPQAKFCDKCGASLTLPPQPATHEDQPIQPEPTQPDPPTPDAERRQLTVMFCDLADSTKLSQQLDPEDLRDVIRAYQSACTEVIERYDGYIAQHLGDGLMVYFGWPQAHEDDAQRAVHTGLGILEAMSGLNRRLEQDKGIRLAVRIGIHTGLVVVGEIGKGARQEHLALGETPNIASRIEGIAAPDTIAISAATYQLVRGYFVCEDLGQHMLRGVDDVQLVHRVVRESDVQSRFDVATIRGLTPLVGRESETAMLFERWEQVKEGQGQVILLSGEAGIGKSRLLQVLRDHVAGEPHTRLECRSSPYHQNTALYPITDLLQRMLQWEQDDTPEVKLDKLEQMLRRHQLKLDEAVPLFATLMSFPIPEDRYPPLALSPQHQRQRTLETIVAMWLQHAEQQPVLCILEDLHWTDPSTLELQELLIDQIPTSAILTVLTCRPTFQPPWGLRTYLTPIALSRLSHNQIEQMAEQAAGGKRLPTEVLQQVIEKTDGVPLFVEEMTKAVLESDALQEIDGHYELAGSVSSLAIPSTIQDSLMARLDRLVTAKAVAQYASVIGRHFSYELLQAVSKLDESTLHRELGRLVEAELVYHRGLPPQATYTFKHALIQDAAYQSLLRSTRQQYHQQIAQALEAQFAETKKTQPELLAHHYTEAGLPDHAVDYWQQAAEQASSRSAYMEAVAYLHRALDVLHTITETHARDQRELTLQLALAESLSVVEGYTSTALEPIYQQAREICERLSETPQFVSVLQLMRRYYMMRGDLVTSRQLGEELLDLAKREHDPRSLQEGHWGQGQTLFYFGDMVGARIHLEQSVASYIPQPLTSQTSRDLAGTQIACLVTLARPVWALGYPDQARTYTEQSLALAQELAHPFTLTFAHYAAALNYFYVKDIRKIYELAEAALGLARKFDFPVWSARASYMLGWVLAMQGKIDEGLSQIREALASHRDMLDMAAHLPALMMIAEVCGLADKASEGLQELDTLVGLVDKTGGQFYESEIHRLKGHLLVIHNTSQKMIDEAEACFLKALSVARQQQAKSWELRAATSLARLWQSQGQRQAAYDLLAPVYGWFTEGFDTADLQEAKALLEALA